MVRLLLQRFRDVHSWYGGFLFVCAVAIGFLAIVALRSEEAGYAADEEITVVAVENISARGFPAFPSGLTYTRGAPYSYLCWAVGKVLGQSLTSYRLVSSLFAALTILVTYLLGVQASSVRHGVLGALLMAVSAWTVVFSSWARFYSMFVAVFLVTVLVGIRALHDRRWRPAFVGLAALAFGLHLLAGVLIAVPGFAWVSSGEEKSGKRDDGFWFLSTGTALVAVAALRSFAPNSGPSALQVPMQSFNSSVRLLSLPQMHFVELASPLMLFVVSLLLGAVVACLFRRRVAPLWFLIVTAICGLVFQLGVGLALVSLVSIARPKSGWRHLAASGALLGTATVFWAIHTSAVLFAVLNLEFLSSLVKTGTVYPLGGIRFLAQLLPMLSILSASGLFFALRQRGSNEIRLVAFVVVSGILSLDVGLGAVHPRYVYHLIPLLIVLSTTGIICLLDIAAGWVMASMPGRRFSRGWACRSMRSVTAAAILCFVLLLAHEQAVAIRASGLVDRHESSSILTPFAPRLRRIRWEPSPVILDPGGKHRVVCNDEIACRFLGFEVDYWLATDTHQVETYALGSEGMRTGVYTGAQLLDSYEGLLGLLSTTPDQSYRLVLVFSPRAGKVDWSALEPSLKQLEDRMVRSYEVGDFRVVDILPWPSVRTSED